MKITKGMDFTWFSRSFKSKPNSGMGFAHCFSSTILYLRLQLSTPSLTHRIHNTLRSITKDAPRKIFLVMDNLKVHHCKPVKEWLEKNKERIEVFYLPSYSPELNPDERLNADLKHAITTSVPRRTKDGLQKKTVEHMNEVRASPERVKSYFKDKHVAYAADSQ